MGFEQGFEGWVVGADSSKLLAPTVKGSSSFGGASLLFLKDPQASFENITNQKRFVLQLILSYSFFFFTRILLSIIVHDCPYKQFIGWVRGWDREEQRFFFLQEVSCY